MKIKHEPFGPRTVNIAGALGPPGRVALQGAGPHALQVRSVKNGKYVVVEGPLGAYFTGHNIVGSRSTHELIKASADVVIREMKLKLSTKERKRINGGKIEIERLDYVGYVKVADFGGRENALAFFAAAVAGASERIAVYPGETVIWAMGGDCSVSLYDKVKEMVKHRPAEWAAMNPLLRSVAENYLRIEMRMNQTYLRLRRVKYARDATPEKVEAIFKDRLAEFYQDLRRPFPPVPCPEKLTQNYLLARLAAAGDHLVALQHAKKRQRVAREMRKLGVIGRLDACVDAAQGKTYEQLLLAPVRHGAPRHIRRASLV